MIIYGTGGRLISQGQPSLDCPHCGSSKTLRIDYYVRYIHLFWIPTFSYRRLAVSHCSHCLQSLAQKDMPEPVYAYSKAQKPRVPLQYFSGLFIILAFIIFISLATANEQGQTKRYFQAPQIGDVYGIKEANGQYSLLLLSTIKNDSLGFRLNHYEVASASDLSIIREQHGQDYEQELQYFSKNDLQNFWDKKYIVNIQRE